MEQTSKKDMLLENFIRLLLFAILIAPLIISFQVPFPYINERTFIFRICIFLAGSIGAVMAIRNPKYRPQWTSVNLSIALFLLVMAVANFAGINPLRSFWSTIERMQGWINIFAFYVYFLLLDRFMSQEKWWKRFFFALIMLGLIIGLWAFYEAFLSKDANPNAIMASLGNRSYLGSYSLLMFFLCLYYFFNYAKGQIEKVITVLVFILSIISIYTCKSRGAQLSTGMGFMVMALWFGFTSRNRVLKMAAFTSVAAIISLSAGLYLARDTHFFKTNPVLKRFREMGYDARLLTWQIALKGFAIKPALGWGQENYNYIFDRNYPPVLNRDKEWFDDPHNNYLKWLSEGGILGFLACLLIPLALYVSICRSKEFDHNQKAILVGVLTAYYIQTIFLFDHITLQIVLFFLFCLVHQKAKPLEWKLGKITLPQQQPMLFSIGLGAVSFAGFVLDINERIAIYYLRDATTVRVNNLKQNLDSMNIFLKRTIFYEKDGMEFFIYFVNNAMKSPRVSNEEKQMIFTYVDVEMGKVVQKNLNDAKTLVTYGTYLSNFSANRVAYPHLIKALEISPNKPKFLLYLGDFHLRRGEHQEALNYYKRFYELDPGDLQNREALALTLIYMDREAEIDGYLQEHLPQIFASPFFLKAYIHKNLIGRYIERGIVAHKQEIKNPDIALNLAQALYRVSQDKAAIAVLEETKAQNPEFQFQADKYIRFIRSQ